MWNQNGSTPQGQSYNRPEHPSATVGGERFVAESKGRVGFGGESGAHRELQKDSGPSKDRTLPYQDPQSGPQQSPGSLGVPSPQSVGRCGCSLSAAKSEFRNKTVLFRSELRTARLERERELIDEPIAYTVGREVKSICKRTSLIFVPCLGKKAGFLKDCRLPIIQGTCGDHSSIFRAESDGHIIFATVFFSNVVGSILITLNARFLGLNAGFFETICMMGYCLSPLTGAALVTAILVAVLGYWVKFLIVLGCFLWSCLSVGILMSPVAKPGQILLLIYPICLYYFFQAVFILSVK